VCEVPVASGIPAFRLVFASDLPGRQDHAYSPAMQPPPATVSKRRGNSLRPWRFNSVPLRAPRLSIYEPLVA
jgi:hypothetical protein